MYMYVPGCLPACLPGRLPAWADAEEGAISPTLRKMSESCLAVWLFYDY